MTEKQVFMFESRHKKSNNMDSKESIVYCSFISFIVFSNEDRIQFNDLDAFNDLYSIQNLKRASLHN